LLSYAACILLNAALLSAQASTTQSATTPIDEKSLVISDQEPAADLSGKTSVTVDAWYFIRMILILAVVVAAIYGVFYLIKKSGKPKASRFSGIKILGSTALGSSRFLHLASVGRQVFLIGTGEGGVSMLSEITDREAVDTLLLEAESNPSGAGLPEKRDFGSVILGFLNRENRKKAGGADSIGPDVGAPSEKELDFLRRQRERLKKY
jgi:flagellar protein FliO/FliZ